MTLPPETVTLGLLAGGQATRLGGNDKAWLTVLDEPQVLRLAARFAQCCGQRLVSANRDLERYARQGLIAIPDRHPNCGPIAGLEALAARCQTPWLFTLPVDALDCDPGLLDALANAGDAGAVASDADGLQPLFALYPANALRAAVVDSISSGQYSIRGLQQAMRLPTVPIEGVRFGNLNTPEDLAVARREAADARSG